MLFLCCRPGTSGGSSTAAAAGTPMSPMYAPQSPAAAAAATPQVQQQHGHLSASDERRINQFDANEADLHELYADFDQLSESMLRRSQPLAGTHSLTNSYSSPSACWLPSSSPPHPPPPSSSFLNALTPPRPLFASSGASGLSLPSCWADSGDRLGSPIGSCSRYAAVDGGISESVAAFQTPRRQRDHDDDARRRERDPFSTGTHTDASSSCDWKGSSFRASSTNDRLRSESIENPNDVSRRDDLFQTTTTDDDDIRLFIDDDSDDKCDGVQGVDSNSSNEHIFDVPDETVDGPAYNAVGWPPVPSSNGPPDGGEFSTGLLPTSMMMMMQPHQLPSLSLPPPPPGPPPALSTRSGFGVRDATALFSTVEVTVSGGSRPLE